MKVGEISNPIKKQNKIIFLKLNDKKILMLQISLESLKRNYSTEKNEMFKLYSNSYLSQLRNSKYIEYFKWKIQKKIAVIIGDPNSINSEIIFKSWKKLDTN